MFDDLFEYGNRDIKDIANKPVEFLFRLFIAAALVFVGYMMFKSSIHLLDQYGNSEDRDANSYLVSCTSKAVPKIACEFLKGAAADGTITNSEGWRFLELVKQDKAAELSQKMVEFSKK